MFQIVIQSFVVKFLVALINFSILIISAKYLGVSTRGEISIFILNLALIQGLSDVYTGFNIVQFVPKFNFKKIIFNGAWFIILVCLLSNSLLIVSKKQVEGYEKIGVLVSILVVANTFNCMLLLGLQKVKLFNLLSFLQPFLLVIGILFQVFYSRVFTFNCYLYPLLFSFAIAFFVSSLFIYIFKNETTTQKFELTKILNSGVIYQASIVLFLICNRYNYYVLQQNKQIGLYSSACMLMEALLLLAVSLAPVLLSKISNLQNKKEAANLVLSFAKISFLVTLIFSQLIFLVPENCIIYFLGKSFIGIKDLMIAYCPAILFCSFFTLINIYFLANSKSKYILVSFAIGAIVTLIFSKNFIIRYDTQGAALTTNCSYALVFFSSLYFFIKNSKIKWNQLFSLKNEIDIIKNLRTIF